MNTDTHLERQADHVADRVLRQAPSSAPRPLPGPNRAGPQRKAQPGQSGRCDRTASPSGGRPLSEGERGYFEPRFGMDFGSIRIHEGGEADESARAMGARAFTLGSSIVMRAGAYREGSSEGRKLLAHELTHVVQQSGGARGTPVGSIDAVAPTVQRQAHATGGQPPSTIEEALLCVLICFCDLNPIQGAGGRMLRQLCVSQILQNIDQQVGYLSHVKAEVSYDMTQSPPRPIMSNAHPLRPSGMWGVMWYMRRHNLVPGRGQVRRPDVVITRSPGLVPEQGNLTRVIEIKFPGDTLSRAQRRAYETIAGNPSNFRVLTTAPGSCNCGPMQRQMQLLALLAIEILLLLILAGLLLADDATVIGTVDDPLLIPIFARLAVIIPRMVQLAPRFGPLLLPVLRHAR